MDKRNPYRQKFHLISGGATNEYLYSDRVKAGWAIYIQIVGSENETTTSTKLRLFIEVAAWNHYVAEQSSPTNDILYWLKEDFYLVEGERLGAQWNGSTSGDVLTMYITGYQTPLKKE